MQAATILSLLPLLKMQVKQANPKPCHNYHNFPRLEKSDILFLVLIPLKMDTW